MNKLKKSVSLILAVFIFCLSFSMISYADSGKYEIDANISLAEKIAIGIGAVENYDADATVTAGDFAKAINVISNYQGTADKYFGPEAYAKNITYYDALLIMCDILGYGCFFEDTETQQKSGIFATAAKYGVSRSLSLKADDTMTMRELCVLLYNTLLANPMVTEYYESQKLSYKKSSSDYLDLELDMYLAEGIVETTSYSSLKSYEGTESDTIIISGNKYYCSKSAYEDYIGMKVTALVHNDGNKKYILALFDSGRCQEVSAYDICFDETDTSRVVWFDNDNNRKTLNISPSADVLYNGKLLRNFTADDLKISQGRLVLIDNGGDKKYDVIKIEQYKSMYVFSYSYESETISGRNGQTIDISQLIKNEYPIYDGDKVITALNLPTNKVITYYEDREGNVVKIYISNKTTGGVIEEFDKISGKLVLSGEEYHYTAEIKEDIEKLDLGTTITADLNVYNDICSFEIAGDSYLYAYLISFDEGLGLCCPRVKIFSQSEEIEVLECKSHIKFNGSKVSSSDIFKYNLNTGLWDEIGKISQLIKYKTSGGKLSEILLEADVSNTDKDRPHKQKDGVYSYYDTPHTLSANVRLNRLTRVFMIPTDLTYEKKFKYGDYSLLSNDTDYTVRIYDIDEDYYAGTVVVRIDPYGSKSVDDMGSDVYIALGSAGRFITDLDEESSVVYAYKFFQNEELAPVRLKFNHDSIMSTRQSVTRTVKDLKFGDVFQVAHEDGDMTQESSNMKLWYVPGGEILPYTERKSQWYSANTVDCFISDSRTYAAGTVIKTVKDGFMMNFGTATLGEEYNPAWDRIISVTSTTKVMICDRKNEKITKGCVGDIMPGDEIFTVLVKAVPSQIIVYRN